MSPSRALGLMERAQSLTESLRSLEERSTALGAWQRAPTASLRSGITEQLTELRTSPKPSLEKAYWQDSSHGHRVAERDASRGMGRATQTPHGGPLESKSRSRVGSRRG